MKRLIIMAIVFALAACSDSDNSNNSDSNDYKYDFLTGTYELTNVTINGHAPDSKSTYLMKFSIDRQADKLVLLEAMALYAGNSLVEREFEYKANQWNYSYSRWDQDFDSCGEMTGNKLTCTDRENGHTLAYTITKLDDSFNADLDLLGEEPNGSTVTIDDSENNGTYGLVEYSGSTCRVEGELFLMDDTTALYDLDLERGCPKGVKELDTWNKPNFVDVEGWDDRLLTIKVNGIPLKFKKFSDEL